MEFCIFIPSRSHAVSFHSFPFPSPSSSFIPIHEIPMGFPSPLGIPFPRSSLIRAPSNTWLPGPTRVHTRNGTSIGLSAFARLTVVTNRETDRPQNVNDSRLHSHAVYATRQSIAWDRRLSSSEKKWYIMFLNITSQLLARRSCNFQ